LEIPFEDRIDMQAVIVARKRVGPVVAGILKLVQPTVELLHDAGLTEARLRDKRDHLRLPTKHVVPRLEQHGKLVLPAHELHERLSLSGENAICTLQNVQVPCQVNDRVNRKTARVAG
jgi:hypothetical protein